MRDFPMKQDCMGSSSFLSAFAEEYGLPVDE